MEACVSPAHRRQLPEKWEASPVARQRLGRGAVTSNTKAMFYAAGSSWCGFAVKSIPSARMTANIVFSVGLPCSLNER